MKTELRWVLLALSLTGAACSTPASKTVAASAEEAPLRAMLAYYASSPRPPVETVREKSPASDPYAAMQLAIQLGHARPPELLRASNLLEGVMKSSHPHAVSLAPLARLLHEQYAERLRLDQHWREAQRRSDQLQEKIDALSAIERSLPARPLPKRKAGGAAP